MPPKGKKEVDEADLPPIDRSLVKVRFVGAEAGVVAEIKARFQRMRRRGVVVVSRERVLEWAETNGYYVNLGTWDAKKKLPEGVPTAMSRELMVEM